MNRETSHTFKNLTSKLTSKTYSCSNKSIEERNIRRDLKKFEEKETPRTLELNEGISRCEQPTAIWQKVRLPIGRNVKNGYKGGTKREKEREKKRISQLGDEKVGREKRGREEEQQRGKFASENVTIFEHCREEGHSNGYVAKNDR